MLSILIPTYNYDVSELVKNVSLQLESRNVVFEIIVFEDGSNINLNTNLQQRNTRVLTNKTNIGRVKARQFLAEHANYNWLLFLDADVIPKSASFISNYLKATTYGYNAIFGGFAYHSDKPSQERLLRWKYGKTKEQIPAVSRNKKPYKVIISANYLIKKSTFNSVNSKMIHKGYGYDYYFGALLKQQQIKVLHIDNEVYHLGIEKSEDYLNKKEEAAETLLKLSQENAVTIHDNDLLKLFTFLKRYQLVWFFSVFYKMFRNWMRINLIGNNPSINLLQVYKITYMCYKYRERI